MDALTCVSALPGTTLVYKRVDVRVKRQRWCLLGYKIDGEEEEMEILPELCCCSPSTTKPPEHLDAGVNPESAWQPAPERQLVPFFLVTHSF